MSTATNPTCTATTAPELGAFCWIELHTRDRDGARAFFTKVIGWTMAKWDDKGQDLPPIYEEWLAPDGAHIGGMMTIPPGVPDFVPSNFATYVNVADVDAAAARVPTLGGKVIMPPMDIPEVGRFAVIADPTGACLNIFKGCGAHGTRSTQSLPGHFCWNELMTTDPKAAGAFYCALLGYSSTTMPMPGGEYTMFAKPRDPNGFVGGMMKIPAEAQGCHPCWLPYVCVGDVDAVTRAATSAGGSIRCEPCDVPGFGRSAVIADKSGAALGLFTPASR